MIGYWVSTRSNKDWERQQRNVTTKLRIIFGTWVFNQNHSFNLWIINYGLDLSKTSLTKWPSSQYIPVMAYIHIYMCIYIKKIHWLLSGTWWGLSRNHRLQIKNLQATCHSEWTLTVLQPGSNCTHKAITRLDIINV